MTGRLRNLGPRDDAPTVTAALARAEGLISAALREAEAIRARACDEADAARAARDLCEKLSWAQALHAEEGVVIALACEVALAVLGREATSGDEVLRDVTRRAMERVRRARLMLLRVNPADAPAATRSAETWLPEGLSRVEIEVFADEGVARGGVIVESEVGRVDARLELLCAEVARILDGSRRVV